MRTQTRTRTAQVRRCPSCGAPVWQRGARFCSRCGTAVGDEASELPEWQQPAPARYSHVSMRRMALSCPECGEPMRFGFRHMCRRCGARLVMVPRFFHPNHVRVYVAGPRAALTDLAVEGLWLMVGLAIVAGIGALM